jgi:ABC-type branched-subunit amino acid transport system ATPase component
VRETLPAGVTAVLGPSGAGKTSLLESVAGLRRAATGRVAVGGEPLLDTERGVALPPEKRRVGYVPQDSGLFPHLSVLGNVRFGAHADRKAVDAAIDTLELRPLLARPPATLSGGERQRVALARALATRPRLLLLDEPASGLSDHETETLAKLLRSLAAEGMAVLLVEHDVGLVMNLCASVHVIDYGALVSVGTPTEIRRNQAVLNAYLGNGSTTTKQISAPTPLPALRPPEQPLPEDEVEAVPVLELRSITAAYGKIEVLHGIDIVLPRGKVVALLGPNGSGKSTTLKVASGQMRPSGGCLHLGGRHVNAVAGDALARVGFCTIPEGRGVFPNLSVRENLVMASYIGLPLRRIEERTYAYFPRLKQRRFQLAGTLSGGEQRMLALARALVTEPTALLLDEMSMGLAPLIVEELYALVDDIAKSGVSILLVEQFAHIVLGVADQAVVMVQGRIVAAGHASEIESELASVYLGAKL